MAKEHENENIAETMKAMQDAGYTVEEIAKYFGIPESEIRSSEE